MWIKGMSLKCENEAEVAEITAEMDELEILYKVEGLKIRFLDDPDEENLPKWLKKKREDWWKTI